MPPKNKKVFEQDDDDEDGDIDLSREGRNIVLVIRVDINALREEFVALLRGRDREIEGLKAEISELHKRVDVLDAKLDDAEAHDRRDMLVFSGEGLPPAASDENCTNILCSLIKHKLKLNILSTDVSRLLN